MRRDAAGGSNSTEFLRGAGTWHMGESPKGSERPKGGGGGARIWVIRRLRTATGHQAWSQRMLPLLSEERLFI